MLVTWEPGDIRAGVRVRKPGCRETWIIGYDPAAHRQGSPAFALISLADGLIAHKGMSEEALASSLNEDGTQPIALVGEPE